MCTIAMQRYRLVRYDGTDTAMSAGGRILGKDTKDLGGYT